ncbi:MAG: CRISPR-associated endoribonuclease Cas6 [Ignavibacteriae bacterium]|nr:MAG: CRISPR-associated endoribonuclease Cas6 [Ignavibacteriota bacterium]
MRLRLKLKILNCNKLNINYYYPLSAAIYKLLQFGSPEFSEFLHEIGFSYATKTYKLFTFALRFKEFRAKYNVITLFDKKVDLYISSPLINDFIKNFVIGSFQEQQIEISSDGIKTTFIIEQMETLPEPQFRERTKFIMYSPLVLSKNINYYNYHEQYYLRYYDSMQEINRIFNINLKNKYRLIYGKDYSGEDIKLEWDNSYIERMEIKQKRVTKKIRLRSYTKENKKVNVDVIGNQLPFFLTGNHELIKVGYDSGYGEKNSSLGCGLAEVVK